MATRNKVPIILFGLLFATCVALPYAWFNTDIGRVSSASGSPYSRVLITLHTNIPGYKFIVEPVSDDVRNILRTTNIVSGTFYRMRIETSKMGIRSNQLDLDQSKSDITLDIVPDRITVFLATWMPSNRESIRVLGHTPDICWTSTGWTPIDLGQPEQVTLRFPRPYFNRYPQRAPSDVGKDSTSHDSSARDHAQSAITFYCPLDLECRAFESPDRANRELTVWCVLAGGVSLTRTSEANRYWVFREDSASALRVRSLYRLWSMTLHRTRVREGKQFVRCSVPVTSDWQISLNWIKAQLPFCVQLERNFF
jgi:hypothetical protein